MRAGLLRIEIAQRAGERREIGGVEHLDAGVLAQPALAAALGEPNQIPR
ncbi:MAG: hypothetical protein ACREFH_15375 [Stellaceae bacterium]